MDNRKPLLNKDAESSTLSGESIITPIDQTVGTSNVWQATVNVCKCGLGSTLLFMPAAFSTSGWLEVIFILFLTGVMCSYSWCRLIEVLEKINAEDKKSHTLQTACGRILGKKYETFTETITSIFNIGSIIGYMVFILNSLDSTLSDSFLEGSARPYVILAPIVLIFVPFAMVRKIEKLSFFSGYGVFAIIFAFAVVIGDSLFLIFKDGVNQEPYDGEDGSLTSNVFIFSQIPQYFGIIMFAYDINGVITDVHSSMIEKEKFPTIIRRYVFFMFSCGTLIGGLAYLALGKSLASDPDAIIFNELGNLGHLVEGINVMYSLAILASMLLFSFPIFKLFDALINTMVVDKQSFKNTIARGIARTLFYFAIMLFAILYPKITNVLNLLGSIFSVTLGFVFPIILYEITFKGKITKSTKIYNILVLILGITGGISGVYFTF